MEVRLLVRRFALDILVWYTMPALFLTLYVGQYHRPLTSVAPHLQVAAIPLLALTLTRIALQPMIRSPRLRQWLVALISSSLLVLLLMYYGLVLIGLSSWGGVVAWQVIPTFFAQTAVAADSLGVPLLLIPVLCLTVYVLLTWICRLYFARFDWLSPGQGTVSRPTRAIVATALGVIFAIQAYEVCAGQWTYAAEPVSLTFFPPSATLDLEGYSLNPVTASAQDQLEDEARRKYVPAAGARRNLVLIVVDALRPDHMGLYGYQRDTTPELARIAATRNTRVISGTHATCADTACGLYSLFSSKYTNEYSFHPFVLHEALQRSGYRIHLVLSGDHTFFHSGFKSLYGPVDSFYDGTQAHGYFLNDDQLLIDHVAAMPDWGGEPTFFQFHLMSAHLLRKMDAVPGKFQPARRYGLRGSRDLGAAGQPSETAVNFYDNGVREADRVIGELLTLLHRKGYLGNALVAVTADHGESLGEHGLFTHANSVREEVLRIPLVLISYGYEPASRRPARPFPAQVDIAPTLLAELSVPAPSSWQGQSIFEPPGTALSTFEEHWFAGLLDQRAPGHAWKYWVDRQSHADHVFDLASDPHEQIDLRDRMPRDMLQNLRELTRERTAAGLH